MTKPAPQIKAEPLRVSPAAETSVAETSVAKTSEKETPAPTSVVPATVPDTLADPAPAPVSLATIYWIFFQIGSLSVGGGLTAWLYRETVEKRRLMTETDFMGALTLAQVLPGINMTNLSVYVGQRLRGKSGALTALLGLISVPFFAIIAFASAYTHVQSIPILQLFLDGVATAAAGLLLSMGIKAVKVSGMERVQLVIMGLVIFTVGVLRWPMIPVILVLSPISVALVWPWGNTDGEGLDDA